MLSIPIAEDDIWTLLNEVKDPEIPVVSLVDMGIVREVELEGGKVTVTITPTFSGCPALRVMEDEVKAKLLEAGCEAVEVKSVLAPPWTSDWITESARKKLEAYGVTPPQPAADTNLIQLSPPSSRCPRCGSFDTTMTNSFGSTLCKTLHTCNRCLEPFEAFKTV